MLNYKSSHGGETGIHARFRGVCRQRRESPNLSRGTMNQKEEFSQIEPQDPMRQAFGELFGPLLSGESIFIEIHSRVPTTSMGPLFTKIMFWGLGNNLVVDPIDIAMSPGKDSRETHKRFVNELKMVRKQAKKKSTLLLVRRFYRLKKENYPTYKKLFLDLVSQKNPVGIIIETQSHPVFIQETELTELGKVKPYVVDIEKVISPRNSSYIPR